MQLFSWMQNKFNGGQGNKVQTKNQPSKEPRNEEFNGWPDSLLAIGTFGASSSSLKPKNQNDNDNDNDNEISEDVNYYNEESSSPDLAEFTPEEVGKLQKELTKLLSKKPAAAAKLAAAEGRQDGNLPLDRFLNCPSSLEVDRRTSSRFSSTNSEIYENLDEEEIDRTIRAIIGRCKDHVCKTNNKKTVNGMKSVTFLLKKMFVCSSGFAPTPNLRDTFPESRMEKLLRTILSKKIIPQSASRISTKRYLEDRCAPKEEVEDKKRDKTCDGSKWVKTDSDFIVLEI
ncbi:protein DEEPER ROOTING 1-like [Solanum verrucosum]|uniref:protein DEEPER ROOTING 1-like n=1 Tax=Solanum verrucosum TaxID=315347 RepID=UPI0020D1901A|nr:protein DEEPER ROOTING 1-like [Solanum verrucosum]